MLMEQLRLLLTTFRLVVQAQKFLLIDERAIALSENKGDRSLEKRNNCATLKAL